MKATLLSLLFLVSFSVFAQEKDNTLTPEEYAEGWMLLFNGKNLDGWRAYKGDVPRTWNVEENALHCTGQEDGDDILTKEVFEDFDLKFDWKIGDGGNSGVLYKVREGQWKDPYHTGMEFQVFGDINQWGDKSTGGLYDVYAPSETRKLNPSMQWNSGRIRLRDNVITHWINGVIVLECIMFSDDWNKRISESKWRNRLYYAKSPFGHIDLQNHDSEVWYKNIKIKKL